MHRRDFLAGALALPALSRSFAHVVEPLAPTLRLGCAAITWGGQDDAAIDDIAALGFRGIQLRTAAFERWGANPGALRELLAARGLAFVAFSSGNIGLDPATFDDDIARHLTHARFVRDCGGRFLQVIDDRPRGRAPAPADFVASAKRLDALGARVADLGLTLAYHNHMGATGEAPAEVDAVLARTNPKHVRLLLDIAHWKAAGGDPVAAIRQYADRLAFLHLKDVQRVAPGDTRGRPFRFVELGAGEVDVKGALAALTTVRYDGWGIVELDSVTDPALTPKQCNQRSRDFLSSLGYRS